MFSPEVWHTTIDNMSDNLFVNQSTNRKNALKNKFDAVFNMLDENNYNDAIDKLTNDIMRKLDADGKADWVKEPSFTQELNVLIGMLRHEL